MKFSTALALSLAPLALARRVHNIYPPTRRDLGLAPVQPRNGHLKDESLGHLKDESLGHVGGGLGGGILGGITSVSKTEVIIIWGNPGGEAATTTYNKKVTVTETVTAPPVGHPTPPPVHEPATHTVTVGGPAGLIYQPDQLHNVPIGDMVIFEFLAENHTVTQSGFDTPCDPMEGGMDTGHQPNPDNTVVPPPQVAMQVTTDKPLWFYCKTGNHCGSGMVFSINPTAEKSQEKFKQLAIDQNGKAADDAKNESTPITGGTPPPAKEEPPVKTPPPAGKEAPVHKGAVPGKGVIGADGSCHCMVSCSASSFPAGSAQGFGAVGGMSGALPMSGVAMR